MDGFWVAMAAVVVLAPLNALAWPFVVRVALPIVLVTLGPGTERSRPADTGDVVVLASDVIVVASGNLGLFPFGPSARLADVQRLDDTADAPDGGSCADFSRVGRQP